jgi:hypothetical protein
VRSPWLRKLEERGRRRPLFPTNKLAIVLGFAPRTPKIVGILILDMEEKLGAVPGTGR